MKVFIVHKWNNDTYEGSYDLSGVFSTRENAETFIRQNEQDTKWILDFTIQEMLLDEYL